MRYLIGKMPTTADQDAFRTVGVELSTADRLGFFNPAKYDSRSRLGKSHSRQARISDSFHSRTDVYIAPLTTNGIVTGTDSITLGPLQASVRLHEPLRGRINLMDSNKC